MEVLKHALSVLLSFWMASSAYATEERVAASEEYATLPFAAQDEVAGSWSSDDAALLELSLLEALLETTTPVFGKDDEACTQTLALGNLISLLLIRSCGPEQSSCRDDWSSPWLLQQNIQRRCISDREILKFDK